MKPISTIAADLRTSNPELGHPTARDLNNMLLVKGLICNVVDGKAPTSYGRQKGIQKKVGKDDMGRRFCYPVYNDLAEQHVKALAIEYFAPVVIPAAGPAAPVPTATGNGALLNYRYSRKDHDDAKNQHRDLLVLLEGPDDYWTYFQDARAICRIMGWNVHKNKNNAPGIAFSKDQLGIVLHALDSAEIGWIVCSPSGNRFSDSIGIQMPEEDEMNTVDIGSFVRVLINGSQEKSFYITEGTGDPGFIVHITPTGMVLATTTPNDFSDNSITTDSPVGHALQGKRVGDVVIIPGQAGGSFMYQILEIK